MDLKRSFHWGEHLLENDNERTQSIAGFEWIVSIPLNAN